jgi:hypothetical protein
MNQWTVNIYIALKRFTQLDMQEALLWLKLLPVLLVSLCPWKHPPRSRFPWPFSSTPTSVNYGENISAGVIITVTVSETLKKE